MGQQAQHAPADANMVTIEPRRLAEYVKAIFAAIGASQEVAARMANSLVDSNLAGHDSHGVIRVSQYIRDIRDGQMDPRAEPIVVREGPSWAVVNGNWGFGHETARFSMAQAIEKARSGGIGVVSAVCCNHIGRLGEWAEQAAAARMIGLATVGFGSPKAHLVAPHGGSRRVLSTNPIAIGAPRAGAEPLLLDFATSISPEGKVRVARDKGVPLPEGVLIDKDGKPTTDPNALYAGGALLPVGGHKGYALAMMVEVLSTALSGADEPEMHAPTGANSGSFFLAIDPTVFRPFEGYAASIERLVERVTTVPPAPDFEKVLLPGEPEQRCRAERAAAISLPLATWKAVAADAESLGVPVPDLRDVSRS